MLRVRRTMYELQVDEDECWLQWKRSAEKERAGGVAMSGVCVAPLGREVARGEGEDAESDRERDAEGCGEED